MKVEICITNKLLQKNLCAKKKKKYGILVNML